MVQKVILHNLYSEAQRERSRLPDYLVLAYEVLGEKVYMQRRKSALLCAKKYTETQTILSRG